MNSQLIFFKEENYSNMDDKWTTTSVAVTAIPLCIVIVIGIFGNLMVVLISAKGNCVRIKGRALIASLAFADTLESLNLIFMLVSVAKRGQWIFGDSLCELNGFMTTEFVLSSMYSLTAISLNRYFMVVKQGLYRKVFTARNQALMIAFIWCIPLPLATGALLGWSKFEFQPGKCICLFYFSRSISFSSIVLVVGVPVPIGIISFCCFQIFKEVKNHSNQVQSMTNEAPNVNVEEVRITKTLAVVVAAYLICFIPAATINLMEMVIPQYKIPPWIDMLSMILVFCNHANNPVIYGVLNKQYRKAFKGVLRNLIVGRCSFKTFTDNSSHSIALGDSVDVRKGKVSHQRHVLSDQGNLLNDSSKVTAP
ncbi:melatonin receptor type 1B-like isoform X1 [Acropora millepora]|uniref:melatonin receptor type 1B-like isoform X1 n=1 Tax=Acropora millepora TaxID=45264 RepID=UPI001CF264CA|nr:melatonin receptor type 1B-like isoform X1 [Acropora millepora]